MTIGAPEPGQDGSTAWSIDVDRWVPVASNAQLADLDEDYYGTMTGQSVLRCVLPARPSAESLADLLRRLGHDSKLLPRIARRAEIGPPLEGNEFVVTALGEG